MKRHPDSHIEDLIEKLNKLTFEGVGMDSFFGTFITVKYINSTEKLNIRNLLKEILSYFYRRMRSILIPKKNMEFLSKVPLLTFISDRRHIKAMNSVFLDRADRVFQCLYLYNLNKKDHDEGVFDNKDLLSKLKFNYSQKIIIATLKIFIPFLRNSNLSLLRLISIYIHVNHQLALFHLFDYSFQKNKPKYILTESDCYNAIVPLIVSARKNGIPTFTQVHGMLNNKIGYFPLLADYVFCWGSIQKERFLKWGVQSKRIVITGATQMNRITKLPSSSLLDEKKRENRMYLVLATNPQPSKERRELIDFFLSCIELLPTKWYGIVRPHPSENKSEYDQLLKGKERVCVHSNDTLNYDKVLSIADHVVVHNSAFAIDAIVNRTPVSIFNIFKKDLGEVKIVIDEGAAPQFSEPIEFVNYCIIFAVDSEMRGFWTKRRQDFLDRYCIAFESVAAQNMLKFIEKVV